MAQKKKVGIRVDFTGVSTEGGGKVVDEGQYRVEVTDATEEESNEGKPYIKVVMKIDDGGDFDGVKIYDNMSLQPQALWKLRSFMENLGIETPEGPMDIDLDELIGASVMIDIIHESYKGKPKNRVNDYSPVEDTPADTKVEAKKDTGKAATTTGKKKAAAATEEAEDEPAFKKGDKVSFKEGKKTIEGVVVGPTPDDSGNFDVKVGKEEYEVSPADLTAVE